jgi:hypothetical protein
MTIQLDCIAIRIAIEKQTFGRIVCIFVQYVVEAGFAENTL